MALTDKAISFGDAITDVYASTANPGYGLGARREQDGKIYRFVSFESGSGAVAAVAGNLCYHVDGAWDVTMDVSDVDRNLVAGVLLSVIADEGFGWIQTGGLHSTVKTNGDDDIALGDAIIASAAGDGTCDSTAQDTAPTNRVVGWAVAADVDANNTVATFLCLDV